MILIAVSLCFDSLAVSITYGIQSKQLKTFDYLKIISILSGVQALFLVLGLFFGKVLIEYVSSFDHWIAFSLLLFLGLKMILDKDDDKDDEKSKKINFLALLLAGVATSIDALFVGFGTGLVSANVVLMGIITFVVTAIASFVGLFCGVKLSGLNRKFNILGGSILIGIGIKILIEHLFF